MLNFDTILNTLEFEDVFNVIYKHSKYDISDLKEIEQIDKKEYWLHILSVIHNEYYTLIEDLKPVLAKHNKSDVESVFGEILYSNYEYLPLDIIKNTYKFTIAKILTKYIYDKYAISKLDLFLDSLMFKQYDTSILNMTWKLIETQSESIKKLFWLRCAKYQNLSAAFINLHYMKFNTPELAYNVYVNSSEFWDCNQVIINKIKTLGLFYK